MQGKFVCVLFALVVLVALSFTEVDACRRCGYDACSCGGGALVGSLGHHIVPQVVSQPVGLSLIGGGGGNCCGGCGSYYDGPAYLPRRYCGGCLSRKLYRLQNNCC